MIATEVKHLMYKLNNEGKLDKFEEVVAFKGIICEKKDRVNIYSKESLDDKDKTAFHNCFCTWFNSPLNTLMAISMSHTNL